MKAEQGYTNNYHEYELSTKICGASDAACTMQNVQPIFARNSYPGGLGLDAVQEGDVRFAQHGILLGGFVQQSVSGEGLSVTNTTTVAHVLNPGYIVRSLVSRPDGIYVDTIGVGWGNFKQANIWFGKNVIFPSLDNKIRWTYCAQAKGGKC